MPIGSLWIAVLLSAVAVFVLSAIIHMALPWHKADYRALKNEDEVRAVISRGSPTPGLYVIPHCTDMKQMKDPALIKKFTDGPNGFFIMRPSGPPAMGSHLLLWFLLCVGVSFVASYVARHVLTPASSPMEVFRLTGTVAFAAYAFGYPQDSIWKGIPWGSSLKGMVDAAVYALATGLVFRACWPS